MSRRHDEDLLCMAFKKHCNIYFPKRIGKFVWTHIANQGRSASQGDKLKKMGVMAGWFDFIFLTHPSPWKAICLEAKVHGNDYSASQETFDYFTTGMPVYKAKFYSVKEGHQKLMESGEAPIMACTSFKEPDYLSKYDKFALAHKMYAPRKDEQ